jgi:hypothetical protein
MSPVRVASWVAAVLAAAAMVLVPGAALAATVTATPATVTAGETTTVEANCSSEATSATLSGTSFGGPSEIPLNAGRAGSGTFAGTVTVPSTTLPGEYQLSVTCSDGDSGTGVLVVSPTGTNAGGGSTSRDADTGSLMIGLSLLALGVAGFILLRRGRASAG